LANRHPSALKRNRQNQKRRARNRAIRSQVRTRVRKVQETIAEEDVPTAAADLRSAVTALAKAGSKGVLHRNTVSRSVSRLSKKVAALQKAAG
jgi:small subunit ribosomal protein S20